MTPDPPVEQPVPFRLVTGEGRRFAVLGLSALLFAALSFGLALYRAEEAAAPREPWQDGTRHGRWLAVFDGHGVNSGTDDELHLAPRTARDPARTHAGLIVSARSYGDVRYEARMRTVEQLRAPEPNPWEVAWLVWAYQDPEHFYYVTLKPNGWELGKRDPAYPGGQRFLATGHAKFPVGAWSGVRVEQRGASLRVWVDGRPLVRFTDGERPLLRGRVGVYTEDARVQFTSFAISPLPAPSR